MKISRKATNNLFWPHRRITEEYAMHCSASFILPNVVTHSIFVRSKLTNSDATIYIDIPDSKYKLFPMAMGIILFLYRFQSRSCLCTHGIKRILTFGSVVAVCPFRRTPLDRTASVQDLCKLSSLFSYQSPLYLNFTQKSAATSQRDPSFGSNGEIIVAKN